VRLRRPSSRWTLFVCQFVGHNAKFDQNDFAPSYCH
jgi:hypothetical protein